MTANLAYIRQVTREVTGNMSPGMFSNEELDQEINNYLRLEFLQDAKLDPQHTFYEFNTVINQRDYSVPSGYINFGPDATSDRLSMDFYLDPNAFYQRTNEEVFRSNAFSGDGATVAFSGTYAPTNRILPGSTIVNDSVETFTDDGAGVLTGSAGGSGTVNYATGAIAATFNTAPTSGDDIWVSYIEVATGRPYDILYYENQFRLYPMPDSVYRIRMKAWKLPVTLDTSTQSPEFDEWGLLIAYGASLRILGRYRDAQALAEVKALYDRQLCMVMRETLNEMIDTRGGPGF